MGDPNYNDVSLLCHFEGSDGGITFVDDGPVGHTITRVSPATTETEQKLFGDSSGYFNGGSAAECTVADHSSLELPGDFTIEVAVYTLSHDSTGRTVVTKNTDNVAANAWGLRMFSGNMLFWASTVTGSYDIANGVACGAATLNEWVRFAVTRSGNTWRTYRNGVKVSEFTSSGTPYDNVSNVYIGGANSNFTGYIDELRVTKGVARYTSDTYDLATAAFPDAEPSDDLIATIPAPRLAMGGGATLATNIPAPVLAMVSDGLNIHIPAPVLAMAPPTVLTLEAVIPAPMLSMGGAVGLDITAPAPVAAFIGDSSSAFLAVAVPSPSLVMDGVAGTAFGMNIIVPGPALSLSTPPTLAIRVPITVAMSGFNGAVGSVGVIAPFPQMSASGMQETLCSMDIRASLRLSAAALSENLGNMRPIVFRLRLVATGLSGADGTMGVEFPITISLAGYPPYVGTMSISYPAPTVEIGVTSEIAAATRTWVLNLRRKALTEYTNFGFNSYGYFRDFLLSAGDAGLFLHAGQDSDAGTPISARVRTGKESFGTSFNKRVPRIYASFRANGGMRFSTITSQGGERVYALPYNGLNEIQERRVPVGRGPKSPYWQFEMANVDGADFLIEKLQPHPERSHRRVV